MPLRPREDPDHDGQAAVAVPNGSGRSRPRLAVDGREIASEGPAFRAALSRRC
jgi:hypothetical protein